MNETKKPHTYIYIRSKESSEENWDDTKIITLEALEEIINDNPSDYQSQLQYNKNANDQTPIALAIKQIKGKGVGKEVVAYFGLQDDLHFQSISDRMNAIHKTIQFSHFANLNQNTRDKINHQKNTEEPTPVISPEAWKKLSERRKNPSNQNEGVDYDVIANYEETTALTDASRRRSQEKAAIADTTNFIKQITSKLGRGLKITSITAACIMLAASSTIMIADMVDSSLNAPESTLMDEYEGMNPDEVTAAIVAKTQEDFYRARNQETSELNQDNINNYVLAANESLFAEENTRGGR